MNPVYKAVLTPGRVWRLKDHFNYIVVQVGDEEYYRFRYDNLESFLKEPYDLHRLNRTYVERITDDELVIRWSAIEDSPLTFKCVRLEPDRHKELILTTTIK